MNHAPVSRHHFRRLHPSVLGEVGGDVDVFVIVHAATLHRKLGDGQHHVRLDMPAFGEHRGRRQILRIALPRAGPDPGVNGRDLLVGQPRIVAEIPHLGISMPGRHLALHYRITNRAGPHASFLVGHERHGRDVVGAVADHAIFEQDWSHIPVEGDLLRRTGSFLTDAHHQTTKSDCDQDEQDSDLSDPFCPDPCGLQTFPKP